MSNDVWDRRRTSFGSEAEAYAVGRPGYPVEAVRWVLPPDATTVVDLGAGTGRLTQTLLDAGVDVVAVEPSAEMRAFVPEPARATAGTAEAIPLPDASVDAVFAGQAFHWFHVPRAMAEMARVLRPGGRVGLLWNMLDDADEVSSALADLIDAEERSRNVIDDQPPPYDGIESVTTPERAFFPHRENYDAERLVAFVHSRSATILLGDDERRALTDGVRRLARPGTFTIGFVCEAWRGERR
jgi:SAM-dependent methyltransferase